MRRTGIAVAAVALLVTACGDDGGTATTSPSTAASTVPTSPSTAQLPASSSPATTLALRPGILASISTAQGPIELAATDDAIWVEIHRGGFLSRIDPVRNVESKRLQNVSVHCDVAAGAGFVWTTKASEGVVTKVDAVTAEPVATVALQDACGVAADANDVWVVSPGAGKVVRYDPTTAAERASIPLARDAFLVAIGPEAVWVAGETGGGTVWRIDPATNKVVTSINMPIQFATGIATGFGAVWVPAREEKVIYRIDPATNEVTATIKVPSPIGGIGLGPDAVWASGFGDGKIYRIDPATNTITGSLETGYGNLGSPLYAFDSLWVSALDRNSVLRIDPSQVK